MAAHRPEEVLCPAEGAVFLGRQEPDLHKLRGIAHLVDVFADPVERMKVAQRTFALLHVRLDDIATVAHPLVPIVALGQLLADELALGPRDDFGIERWRASS